MEFEQVFRVVVDTTTKIYFTRPVQDTFEKYLDTNTSSKQYLDTDASSKKYLDTDTLKDTLRTKYLDTDTIQDTVSFIYSF